ncbi:MAG: glutathione S-transferase [Halieaceae bacterium]|jgi:glutathione S-transferase
MLAYAKGIELKYVPPEGFRTPAFKQFNVLAKVPVLDTGELLLPESIVIMDYLEERFPEPALRPLCPEERAVMNIFYRFSDVYIQPVLLRLFQGMTMDGSPDAAIADDIAALDRQLQLLDELLVRYGRCGHDWLDLADCALAPIMYFSLTVPQQLNGSDVLTYSPHVTDWWEWVQQQEAAARVFAEIEEGMRVFMRQTT